MEQVARGRFQGHECDLKRGCPAKVVGFGAAKAFAAHATRPVPDVTNR